MTVFHWWNTKRGIFEISNTKIEGINMRVEGKIISLNIILLFHTSYLSTNHSKSLESVRFLLLLLKEVSFADQAIF